MNLIDRTIRPKRSRWTWWRFVVYLGRTRSAVRFEDGDRWMYAGVIRRNARSIGPLHVALLRLIGDDMEPYDGTVSTDR